MPVLINKDTGLAEDLDDSSAKSALYAGTHEVPLVDKNGQMGSAPIQDAHGMVQSGEYAQPAPEQLQGMMTYAKHSSLPEQVKTFAEGVARGGSFGLSDKLEQGLLGVTPADQLGRRQTHPTTEMLGQMTGLAGSMLIPGGGEAAILKAAGEGAETALLGAKAAEGLSMAEKAARAGTRLATEGALFQAGDELSRKFEQDPDQTMQSAALNVGMAGLTAPIIGGALNSAGMLWDATAGAKLAPYLQAARERFAMGQGKSLAPGVTPEIAGTQSDFLTAPETHQNLLNSPSAQGVKYREGLGEYRTKSTDDALGMMGYKPEDIPNLKEDSNFEKGQDVVKSITDDIKSRAEPFKQRYEAIEKKYGGIDLSPEDKTNIGAKIANLADEEGYNLSESSPEAKAIARLDKELPNLKTVEDLRKYRTIFDGNASNDQMWGLRRKVLNIFDDARDGIVNKVLGETEGPEALALHENTNKAYRELRSHIDDLNDRLHVGRYAGPDSFLRNLSEMKPEDILNRLNPKNDAGLIQTLQTQLPEVADKVRMHQLDQLVRASTRGDEFNLKTFVNKLDAPNISAEMRNFLMNKDAYDGIKSIAKSLEDLPATDNPSGSGKAIARLFGKLPWHMGAGALLMHGNPILAGLAELSGGLLTRELPDAARVAWLRFLGNPDLPISPKAFNAVMETAHNAMKGIEAVDRAVKQVLPGKAALKIAPMTESQKNRLEKASDTYQKTPELFFTMNDNLGQYEPNHATAQSTMVARAMDAINQAKPRTSPGALLDAPIKPSKVEEATYHKTLQMVQNPMTVMKRIGDGTLTPSELNTFKTVYPGLHNLMSEKITNHLVEMKSKGQNVPYKQRLALSMFMGMPLDSTMTPMAIMSNQPQPPAAPQMPRQPRGSKTALTKMPGIYTTAGQAREAKRATR